MPSRQLVAGQLAKLFSAISHPVRIRIIEELRAGELSVNDLQKSLGIPQAAVSQQLAILRNAGLVSEHRKGRLVYNKLRQDRLAVWIMDGLRFVSPDPSEALGMLDAIEKAKSIWHFDS